MRPARTFRGRLNAAMALTLAIIGSATLYTGFATGELARGLGLLFKGNELIAEIRSLLVSAETDLAGYLTSKSSDLLRDYMQASARLSARSGDLNLEIRPSGALLVQREIARLVDRYLEDADRAVAAKRGRDVAGYTESFEASERSAELIRFLVDRVERTNMAASVAAYADLDRRVGALVATNAALVVAAALMAFSIFWRMSLAVTSPLSALAEAARAVARGEYDRALPLGEAIEEFNTLSFAFENMRASVRRSFEELRSKAEVERRLMEEDLRLMDMDRKLKNAELLALQSQINPHFLFNTLAAGMQLALAEGADRSGDFMGKLAAFIRYALRPPSRSVSVADEIDCVELYVWLLRLRFGDRYRFAIEAEEAALPHHSPALILQPLVENAVTHGLRDVESGGTVRVGARVEAGTAVLEVADSGVGMEETEVARILEVAGDPDELGSGGGIGLHNVVRRVYLATGGAGTVEIESRRGAGTLVRIRLPGAAEEA